MSSGLPATVDPISLADAGARLTGELPVKAMGRLRAMCLDDEGQATAELHFERSGDEGLRQMRGTITAEVHAACQRCLEPMTLVLKAEPSLVLVKPEERSDLLEQQSEVLVADKPISLSSIIEDELLLAMPMIPMHDVGECPAGKRFRAQQRSSGENPFAVLNKLKQKQE
ncbi:MAG: YceD family protein [Acidiferrobacterales bacterium]